MIATINTKTNITISGNHIGIYTFYQKCKNYVLAWINGSSEKFNGVDFIEGQLGVVVEGWDDKFSLNDNGELIVQGVTPEKYAIDKNGYLTSDIDFCNIPVPSF